MRAAPAFAAALLVLIGVASLWIVSRPATQLYAVDSASYIEQARSVLAGDGFQSRPFSMAEVASTGIAARPDRLYPPGYPLLIALTTAVTGLAPDSAAVWLSRTALCLLPIVIFLLFRSWAGVGGAFCLGLFAGATPTVMMGGQLAVSDLVSLLFTAMSFAAAANCWRAQQAGLTGTGPALVSGLLAAFAYAMRNAHIALLAALALSMAAAFAGARGPARRRAFRDVIAWAGGAALILIPLFVRNILVFGSIQPYRMPPSDTGLKTNIHQFVLAQVGELSGSPHLVDAVGWQMPLWFILPVAGVAAALVYLSFRAWPALSKPERLVCLASVFYAVLGAAVIVIARTRYHWGEDISMRHAMPYTLFWLLPAIIVLRRSVRSRRLLLAIGGLALAGWAVLRLPILFDSTGPGRNVRLEEAVRAQLSIHAGACAKINGRWAVSNYAYLYRIICDADAVHPTGLDVSGREMVQRTAMDMASWIWSRAQPDVIALHPGRGVLAASMPLSDHESRLLAARGWTIVLDTPLSLVIERRRSLSRWQGPKQQGRAG